MKALIVIDMQNDFVTGSLGSEAAQKIVPNVLAKVKEYCNNKQMIYLTYDTHRKDYLETEEGKNLPIPHCIEHTDGHKLIKELYDQLNDYSITLSDWFVKPTFGSVDLGEHLHHHSDNLESIEIIGLCTDICVVSNALLIKAFCPNIPIYVDASCCAGTSKEAHDAAIKTMKSCQIHILNE